MKNPLFPLDNTRTVSQRCDYFFPIAFFLLNCSGKYGNQELAEIPLLQATIDRTVLLGIWWSPEMHQSAAFQIKDSTIYYPDAFTEFKYDVKGDSLFIHRDDGISGSRIVKVTADTLVLSTFGEESFYPRSETKER